MDLRNVSGQNVSGYKKIRGVKMNHRTPTTFVDWLDWAENCIRPGSLLTYMKVNGTLDYFPEIKALVGCQQDPKWHPGGDVFDHTVHVVNEAAGQGATIVFGALCHDFGKPEVTQLTTTSNDPTLRWRSPKHDKMGVIPTRNFMVRIGAPDGLTDKVCELVEHHMIHNGIEPEQITKKMLRKRLGKLQHATPDELFAVMIADCNGRPPLPKEISPEIVRMMELWEDGLEEPVDDFVPFLRGKHLIERGFKPGPIFGRILNEAKRLQLSNVLVDEHDAITWFEYNQNRFS